MVGFGDREFSVDKKKKKIILLSSVGVLALGGLGWWFFFRKKRDIRGFVSAEGPRALTQNIGKPGDLIRMVRSGQQSKLAERA